jgi:hypothetical protein
MTRTQIHLPDALYHRVKLLCSEREMTLAEAARRGMELLLERYAPPSPAPRVAWQLPKINGGGIRVPLEELKNVAASDQETRGLPR